MKQRICLLLVSFLCAFALTGKAQKPTVYAVYTDKEGGIVETTNIDDGQAPLAVTFRATPPEGYDDWTFSYEWHFIRTKSLNSEPLGEIFVRYENETSYTFTESGDYTITAKGVMRRGDESNELDTASVTISIAASSLEFPNAFSPNGDGHNDIYRAKKDFKNIISFRAIILNRWGQKLYEWNNPADGWDGKYKGNDVKEGVYFVYVEARGADGREYKIRKDVNLLRGLPDNNTGTSNGQ